MTELTGLGIDIVEIGRIRKIVSERKNFIRRVLSKSEIRYCEKSRNRFERIAGRFAAKEAVIKALGAKNLPLKHIQIENENTGRPGVKIPGKVFRNVEIMLSISHTKDYAAAAAVAIAIKR